MSFLFGKRKTPAELLRENKRMLDKSIREIERERQSLQTQEKKLIAEIKKSAKQGQMGAVKVMAKDLVRTRHQIEKFYKLKSQLQGVSLRIQTLKSTQAMGDAMKGVTKAMGQMNRQMNLPSLQKKMQEFMKQNEKMELMTEVMEDAIDDALEGDEEEEETEELVSQVLDEIGINMNQELVNAPSTAVAAPAAKTKVAQAEATGNDDGGIDSDLQARLDNLRRMLTHGKYSLKLFLSSLHRVWLVLIRSLYLQERGDIASRQQDSLLLTDYNKLATPIETNGIENSDVNETLILNKNSKEEV